MLASWLHAAHIQGLHALIDAYAVENAHLTIFLPAASEDADAVAVDADSLALDLSINLYIKTALFV